MAVKDNQAEETMNQDDTAPEQQTQAQSGGEPLSEVQDAAESELGTEPGDHAIELVDAQEKVKDYWDQILRLKAEMQNNQKRAERDVQNAHNFSLKGFAESLLPIVDSMEMGIEASNAENANIESHREGMQLTMNLFSQVLEKHGLYPVDPVGEKFDPEQHQAISMVEDETHESSTVITVMQKGYLLNGRLVRPAMVVVAK